MKIILENLLLIADDDEEITKKFLEAVKFPEDILGELAAFLDIIREPLAVRSSSLLEDSQYHPFAGVYETYMLPNNQNQSADTFERSFKYNKTSLCINILSGSQRIILR